MPARRFKPIIAVTSGDPGGIGPEIVANFFAQFRPRRSIALVVGAERAFEPHGRRWRKGVASIGERDVQASLTDSEKTVYLLDTRCRARYASGRDSRGGGQHAGRALDLACELAKRGGIHGLVTAPISKKSLNLAGYPFAGHTELLAAAFDAPHCQMVMTFGRFRVIPLTRHIPVQDISGAITQERVLSGLESVNEALIRDFGISHPHIGLAALNPHAGDGGLLGREEIDVIEPALRKARRRGIRVTGPVSGDALFQQVDSGTFDAFVSMYHDQGLIPFKMRARRRGVNVTVGLPIVRTSVDHGVAYDIVGKGIASFGSLKAAYALAETLSRRRIITGRRT